MSLQFRRGLDADRTSITPLPGEPLWITDTDELYVGDGSTAGGVLITGGGGGGAPTNAKYIVQTSNATLTQEQSLGDLTTGILKNTVTAGVGVLSTAVGTDLPSHTHTLADITDDGTMAAQNANNVAITGGSLTDVTVTTGTYSSRANEAIMHAVRKASAGTISKGEVVRITGSSGTHLQVELADASVEATSTGTIGIAATTITNTTTGYMMITGELTQLSNVPTASFTNGAALWLSETTGEFTTTRPTQPAHGVFLGWVVEASNGSAGRIYVKVINYSELNELHDVLINTGTLADNHFLVYDNATSLWKNEAPATARTSLGLGTAATSNTGDFAAASHTHAASAITSGTIDTARLGSGTASNTTYLRGDQTWATVSGGGVSDGTYGDITVSGSGATWTINNDAVTFAKMQNIATDKLLGRSSPSSGDVEEITCTSAGRALLDDANAADQRTTLGLGTVATESTVPVSKGGTNLTTSPTNGQLLIGNGTGYTLATLTQGSNVTITNASGAITIAASGGSAFNPATKSESWSDFIGNSAVPWTTLTNGTGAAVAFTAVGGAANPGVATPSTGSTATGRAGIGSLNQDVLVLGTYTHTFSTAVVLVTDLSTSAQRYIFEAGFMDGLAGPTNGVYFRYSDDINTGKWECVCIDAGGTTTADSGITVAASTWYRLEIEINAAGTSAVFKIDGTTVATMTANIPTGTGERVGIVVQQRKTVGTTSRSSRCDYLYHSSEVTR